MTERNGDRANGRMGDTVNARWVRVRFSERRAPTPVAPDGVDHCDLWVVAVSLLMQCHAGGWGRLWGREFFLQLLDDRSVASRPPFLALLGKLFFQLSALFHVAFPELDTLGFS